MQLISLPVSPFAARVRIAIYAKNLRVKFKPPPPGWPAAREFRDLSPTGRIPVLVLEDGSAIQESSVILEFLEERFPEAPTLLPGGPRARAAARLVARLVDLYLMPPMVALAKPGGSDAERRRLTEDLLDGFAALEQLVEGRYASGEQLSLADCALAPALFAARVTGERLGCDLLRTSPRVSGYGDRVQRDQHVWRVLSEMEEGLRKLAGAPGR